MTTHHSSLSTTLSSSSLGNLQDILFSQWVAEQAAVCVFLQNKLAIIGTLVGFDSQMLYVKGLTAKHHLSQFIYKSHVTTISLEKRELDRLLLMEGRPKS